VIAAPPEKASLIAVTRSLLYRMTLGRLRSPQSVVQSCDSRVKGIGSKMESYTTLAEQLQARMAKGEEEYRSGLEKLRSARVEMQRLSASMARGERSAAGGGVPRGGISACVCLGGISLIRYHLDHCPCPSLRLEFPRLVPLSLSPPVQSINQSIAGVVKALRTVSPKVENVLQLRGEVGGKERIAAQGRGRG